LTTTQTRHILFELNAAGRYDPKERPMVRLLLSAYAAVALYFLRAYLYRPTISGVVASLLWPVSLALALAWLMMLDDDALSL
jgi:hypothetical protein